MLFGEQVDILGLFSFLEDVGPNMSGTNEELPQNMVWWVRVGRGGFESPCGLWEVRVGARVGFSPGSLGPQGSQKKRVGDSWRKGAGSGGWRSVADPWFPLLVLVDSH